MDTGLIHIYCGDGKGKTTAALGLSLRCAGRGGRVLFAQFLKSRPTGELMALQQLPQVTLLRGTGLKKFTFQMNPQELFQTRQEQQALLEKITAYCQKERPDLAVCDELIGACSLGLVPEEKVLALMKEKPEKTELVLTGRNPGAKLLELADYVSEIKKVKHPYDRGIPARAGIEM